MLIPSKIKLEEINLEKPKGDHWKIIKKEHLIEKSDKKHNDYRIYEWSVD